MFGGLWQLAQLRSLHLAQIMNDPVQYQISGASGTLYSQDISAESVTSATNKLDVCFLSCEISRAWSTNASVFIRL